MADAQHRIILVNEFQSKGFDSVSKSNSVAAVSFDKLNSAQDINQQLMIAQRQQISKYHSMIKQGIPLTDSQRAHLDRLSTGFKEFGGNLDSVTGKNQNLLTSFTKIRWAIVNVAMVAAVAYGAYKLLLQPTFELEKQMAGVAKTTGMTQTEIKDLTKELEKTTFMLPVTISELADIAKVAGQLGIAKEDINSFTTSIATISIATGITAQDAATNFAKLANAFNEPISKVINMGNVLNELENTTAATAQGMIDSLVRVAATAESLGLSFEAASAGMATLISAGVGPERAGTRTATMLTKMSTNIEESAKLADMPYRQFVELMETDMDAALKAVLVGLNNAESGSLKLAKAQELFGMVGLKSALIWSDNLKTYDTNLEKAQNSMQSFKSINEEVLKQMDTSSDKFRIMGNQFSASGRQIGSSLNEGLIKPFLEHTKNVEYATGKGLFEQIFDPLKMLVSPTKLLSDTKELNSALNDESIIYKQLFDALDEGNITQEQFNELIVTARNVYKEYGGDLELVNGYLYLAINNTKDFNKQKEEEIRLNEALKQQKSAIIRDLGSELDVLTDYYNLKKKQIDMESKEGMTKYSFQDRSNIRSQISDMEEKIRIGFGKTALSNVQSETNLLLQDYGKEIENTTKATDKYNDSIKLLQDELSNLDDELSNVRDNIKDVNDNISNLLSRRFNVRGISETEIGHLINQQQLELQKAKFASLGLGSAEEFLRDATVVTTDSIDQQTDAVKKLTAAAADGQDQFDAWQTTLTETIRALLINSQDLDKDVTSVVRKAQTELLSITRFDRAGGTQYSAMEQNLDALGLAQSIFFGDEQEQLDYSEQLREDRINGMNESAEIAIKNLEDERTKLDELLDAERKWLDIADEKKQKIEELRDQISKLNSEIAMQTRLTERGITDPDVWKVAGGTAPTPDTTQGTTSSFQYFQKPESTTTNKYFEININGYNKNPSDLALLLKKEFISS